jgi:DNA-binding transcriptional LysR family regulator
MEIRMHVAQLEALVRVARDGSFSRAALSLRIGQPAVSSRIQSLEEELGGALFRRGRRISVTPLGESFLPYARRVLDVLHEGIESARMAQRGDRGRVKVGVLGSLSTGLVAPALASFNRTHPQVDCMLKSADHEVLMQMLLDGIVDLAVIVWPCPESAAADLAPIFHLEEPVVLVAHPRHALALRKSPSRDDVAQLARPFFRLRWWPAHHPELVRLAERAGTAMEVPMEIARYLALQRQGAGFFARTYVAQDLADGALVEIPVKGMPRLTRGSALVRRRRSPLGPAAAELIQVIHAQAAATDLLAATSLEDGRASGPRVRRAAGTRGR